MKLSLKSLSASMNNLKLNELAKATFTNRGYLYFVLFLSVIMNLGYLMANKLDAFALFLAVGVITKCFSDNMAIVLTVCLLATGFAMSQKVKEGFSEGMESEKKSEIVYRSPDDQNIVHPPDPSLLNESSTITPIDDKQTGASADTETDEAWDEATGFKPMNESISGKKSHLDYSETVKQSYKDLNKYLDKDAIKSLTKDTSELMNQQNELYSSIKEMTPLLGQAKTFLKDFDMSDVKKVLTPN